MPLTKKAEAMPESRSLEEEVVDAALAAADEEPEKIEEVVAEVTESSRRRRNVLLTPQIYHYPSAPYLIQPAAVSSPAAAAPVHVKPTVQVPSAVFYQPQYYYHLFHTVKIAPPYSAQGDSEPPKSEDTTEEPEAESATNFPIVLPGAVVAQQPLPEDQFPLFPYDPAQDQPAAVQF